MLKYKRKKLELNNSTPAFCSASVQMKVTEKDVAHVADLANLELTDKERVGLLDFTI